jgi:hypothetical protein
MKLAEHLEAVDGGEFAIRGTDGVRRCGGGWALRAGDGGNERAEGEETNRHRGVHARNQGRIGKGFKTWFTKGALLDIFRDSHRRAGLQVIPPQTIRTVRCE